MRITTNIFLFIITLTFLIGCNPKDSDDSSSYVERLDGAITVDDPVPDSAFTFDANIKFVNFTSEEQEKMEKAIEIIKLVVATDEFKNRVLNYTYDGKKSFVSSAGYTNAQIYQKILLGAETLHRVANNSMDAEVELYYSSSNVIGYTYKDSKRIWVNRKYFDTYTPAGVAHNLFHEWMHKLGFIHDAKWSPSRDHSVPYALGYLIGDIGKDFL